MAIDFRIVPHGVLPGVRIVEVLVNGGVAGVIYPAGEKEIKLVSAHVSESRTEDEFAGEVVHDDGTTSWPPIPSFLVRFDPSPYEIRGNKIVKLPIH